MGKKSRQKAVRGGERPVEARAAIPEPILRGARLVIAEANKNGNMRLSLPGSGYRPVDQFDVNGKRIETGSVGSARPVNSERVQQLFRFAASFASIGKLEAKSFDPKSGNFKPVTVQTREHDVDGYLVYIPKGAAQYTRQGNSFGAQSFTTGIPILSGAEPSISFVTSDSTVGPASRAMAAATEAMQNRYVVEGVTFDRGKTYTDTSAVNPYQETIANGVGNAYGAAISGWTYEKYLEYLSMYEKSTYLWAGNIKGRLGRAAQFIAPHLMLGETTYEQLADGEMPAEPEIIPRQPLTS